MAFNFVRATVVSGVLCAGVVHAGSDLGSAHFTVKGEIKPVACSVSFNGGGVYDYGVIDPKKIAESSGGYVYFTDRPKQDFIINCDAPASLSVKFIDNMSGKVPSDRVGTADSFGLHSNAADPIGFHYFHMSDRYLNVTGADGKTVKSVMHGVSPDNKNWDKLEKGSTWFSVKGDGSFYTAIDSNKKPVSFKSLQSTIASVLAIKKGVSLKDEVNFEGVVTMELNYI